MRTVLALMLVGALGATGCGSSSSSNPGGVCTSDLDCGGEICTRTGECLAAGDIRMVKVTWTVGGAPASATTCASHPDLTVELGSDYVGDTVGWAPVPCAAGQFTLDKIARRFQNAAIGYGTSTSLTGFIDANGVAAFQLP
jgi:hypothetical protein